MSVRVFASLTLSACLAYGAPALAAPERNAPPHGLGSQPTGPTLSELGARLVAAGERQDAAAALQIASAISVHADFSRLPVPVQASVFVIMAEELINQGRHAEAMAAAVRATEIDPSSDAGWFSLLRVHGETDDADAAAETLSRGVRASAALRENVYGDYVASLVNQNRVSPERAYTLMESLYASGWRWEHDSHIWLSLTRERLARGNLSGAAEVAPLIRSSVSSISLHSLRRYDDVRAAAGLADLDIQALLDRELEAYRADPTDLDGQMTLANALLMRGRFDEAIAIADASLQTLPTDDASIDWDNATWLMDTRARALMELGRGDEAVAQMERAAGRLEGSTRNVSQQINLGWMYLRAGRNEDALMAVADMDDSLASPYGVMQAVQVRGCALQALGRSAEAEVAYAYMSEHWRDAPGAWHDALACRGDVSAMSDLMIARLADPEMVEQAVSDMHAYLPRPNPTAFDAHIAAAHAEAIARPDVIAARDVVARGLTIPTVGPQF